MITAAKTVPIGKLVEELRTFPESMFIPTEPVREFLEKNPVDPDSLAPYLTWDRQHYTRNLIDRTPCYELMAICWEVGQVSSVHKDLVRGTCRLEPLDTIEMNISHPCAVDPADPVHRVVNPREFNQRAVSLHVYSRPFDTCVVYSPEQGSCGEIKLHFTTEYGKPK